MISPASSIRTGTVLEVVWLTGEWCMGQLHPDVSTFRFGLLARTPDSTERSPPAAAANEKTGHNTDA